MHKTKSTRERTENLVLVHRGLMSYIVFIKAKQNLMKSLTLSTILYLTGSECVGLPMKSLTLSTIGP